MYEQHKNKTWTNSIKYSITPTRKCCSMLNIELPHLISTVMQSQWHCCYSLYLIIINNIPLWFQRTMVFSKFKIQIWLRAGGWKFSPGSLTWASGLASVLARPHLMWEWEWIITGPARGWSSRHHHHERLLNAETQKSCSAFCHLDYYWGLINEQPLFASLCPISPLSLSFCFVAVLWYWQHCMLVVTVCLQGLHQNKVGVYQWGPSPGCANQSKWSESESKEPFFLGRPTQAWEPLQEHQNRCIIVSCGSCIQARASVA